MLKPLALLSLVGRPQRFLWSALRYAAVSAGVVAAIVLAPRLIADPGWRMPLLLALIIVAMWLRRALAPPYLVATLPAAGGNWSIYGRFGDITLGVDKAVPLRQLQWQPSGALEIVAEGRDGKPPLLLAPQHYGRDSLQLVEKYLSAGSADAVRALQPVVDPATTSLKRIEQEGRGLFVRVAERPNFLWVSLPCLLLEILALIVLPRLLAG
jgi:hypothetical protein